MLFQIITDLFRDHQMSGWLKALWLLFLFLIPFLSALIYLIVRNEGKEFETLKSKALT